jgi:Iap family predicted aminopeptidase
MQTSACDNSYFNMHFYWADGDTEYLSSKQAINMYVCLLTASISCLKQYVK